MPVLPNQRHEKFAQLLAEGKSAAEAYVLAGYRANRHNAARLKSFEPVRQRLLEIQTAGANRAEITLAGVLSELDQAIEIAKAKGQPNALVNAAQLRAKLGGLLVEKAQVEVTTEQYEPADAQEVLHRIAERVSVEAAVTLGRCFGLEFDPTWSPASEPIRARGIGQRLIEERRPNANGRKREI